MSVVLYTGMVESGSCYYDGEYPKLRADYKRFYDDCRIESSYGHSFMQGAKSDDELYTLFVQNAVKVRLSRYEYGYSKIMFTDKCYGQVFRCSKTTITMKNVIDRLIRDYPNQVMRGNSCGISPPKPLKIESISAILASTSRVRLTINISGDKAGQIRIVWGSLARLETKSVDPKSQKTYAYELSLPAGDHTICVDEV